MKTDDGCDLGKIMIDNIPYNRIEFGGLGDFYEGADSRKRCTDCGALSCYYHHYTCDLEVCPKCGEQLITCYCHKGMLFN